MPLKVTTSHATTVDVAGHSLRQCGQGGGKRNEGHVHQRRELDREEGNEHRDFVKPESNQLPRGHDRYLRVTATLEKDCPAGNWTSDVFLETSNAAVAKLRIPVTVNVISHVAAKPEIVSFGDVKMGSSPEQQVTIQSNSPFKILEVKGADEQVTVKIDRDVAQASHTVTITMNPKAKGGVNRTVEIVTDNKEQPTVIVPVTAKVVEK